MNLTEYMTSLGRTNGFKPAPIVCPHTNTVTIYFKNVPSYAWTVDEGLLLYKSVETDEIVGVQIPLIDIYIAADKALTEFREEGAMP